MKVVAETSRAH